MEQFQIVILFIVFTIFFTIGYFSPKRSGGFFMLLAGFTFISFSILGYSYFSYASALMIPFGIFIILQGIQKAFYSSQEKTQIKGE
jgi:uncharacterized membrane protein HdeD (DUF308 family)